VPLFFFFFFTLVTGPRRSLSLKLSDTRVFEPYIRARLGNHNSPILFSSRSCLSAAKRGGNNFEGLKDLCPSDLLWRGSCGGVSRRQRSSMIYIVYLSLNVFNDAGLAGYLGGSVSLLRSQRRRRRPMLGNLLIRQNLKPYCRSAKDTPFHLTGSSISHSYRIFDWSSFF